jgi:hypothetical protein
MTTTVPTQDETNADFQANFGPTPDQLAYAAKYATDHGLKDGVFVLVNFPGKQPGVWEYGQTREAVMCGSVYSLWVERDNVLRLLNNRNCGNAAFRVYPDGHFHLVDESM